MLRMHSKPYRNSGHMSALSPVGRNFGEAFTHWTHFTAIVIKYMFKCVKILYKIMLNSLWPNNVIWRYKYGSILPQVMACCLTASRRHLNQFWLSSKAESNFTRCRMILLYFSNRNSDNILWTIKLYVPPQMHSAKLWLVSPGQNGRHFTDDIFNEKLCILIRVSPKFVPKDPIDN